MTVLEWIEKCHSLLVYCVKWEMYKKSFTGALKYFRVRYEESRNWTKSCTWMNLVEILLNRVCHMLCWKEQILWVNSISNRCNERQHAWRYSLAKLTELFNFNLILELIWRAVKLYATNKLLKLVLIYVFFMLFQNWVWMFNHCLKLNWSK